MDKKLLKSIADSAVTGVIVYVTQDEAKPLMADSLITVDPAAVDPTDANKRAAKITDAGIAYLAGGSTAEAKAAPLYSVSHGGLVLPKTVRKGGFGAGAPVKYPFETMAVNDWFFVPNSDVSKGNAVKTMGSAVGSANQRYMEKTGATKQVTRAKRGSDNKAIKGADGKNETETVTLPVKKSTRKYVVRPVKAGVAYGSFTAPSDGAVIERTE